MKIGIFGDSFGAASEFSMIDESHWVNVIGARHDVTNFSKTGTNLYWSYKLIEKHHNDFDVCILILTGWGRYFTPNAKNPEVQHCCTMRHMERLRASPGLCDSDKKIVEALYNYKLYAESEEEAALFHDMLCERIESMVTNIIIIPTMIGSKNASDYVQKKEYNYIPMVTIAEIDLRYCNMQWSDVTYDKRASHMSPENNIIFGKKLLDYLESDRSTDFKICLDDYTTPTISKAEAKNRYFTDTR